MRNAGRLKLGYFPLPPAEGEKIKKLLSFASESASIIDPCVGDGTALLQITAGATCRRYGIELDSARATKASERGISTIQGSAFETHSRVERFSLLYLNPPYDSEIGSFGNRRMEELFLEHTHRWLKIGGVLVFVIPLQRLEPCADLFAANFTDVRVYRMTDPESERFDQIVVFGTRKRVTGKAIRDTKLRLSNLARGYYPLPDLTGTELEYDVPPSPGTEIEYRGLPLDLIENCLPKSNAYQQVAQQFLMPPPAVKEDRPLTPLHAGHVGTLATAGLLNGVIGEGDERHIAYWLNTKNVTTTEETEIDEENEKTILIKRHTERFSNNVTLLFENGTHKVLGETEPMAEQPQGEVAA